MKTITILCVSAVLLLGAGFAGCSVIEPYLAKAESHTYELRDQVDSIFVDCSEADVKLLPDDGNGYRVICNEADVIRHTVTSDRGELKIVRDKNSKSNVMVVNIPIEILIYLPEQTYREVKIGTSSGNIEVTRGYACTKAELTASSGNVSCASEVRNELTAHTSSGNVHLTGVRGRNASVETSSGDVSIENTVLQEKLTIRTSSGDIRLNGSDAPEIGIRTSSGDVWGSLLSPKVFRVTTSSGSVNVPESRGTQTCEIKTSSGNVTLTVEKQWDV